MRENSFSSNKAKGGARDQGVNEDMQDMHCQGREKAWQALTNRILWETSAEYEHWVVCVKEMENVQMQELQEVVDGIEGKDGKNYCRYSSMQWRSYSLGSIDRTIKSGTYQTSCKYSDIILRYFMITTHVWIEGRTHPGIAEYSSSKVNIGVSW
jgi:hypothetical protein